MHLGLFGCLTELGAKRAELVQKFVPRSRIRFFRNKHTRSSPVDHKLTFWCVLNYLGALGSLSCLTKLRAKHSELVQKFMPRSRVGIYRNECTGSTPLDPKLMFWCVSYHWVHSGPFGCVTKIGAKWAELVRSCHKVASEYFATNANDPTHWTLN